MSGFSSSGQSFNSAAAGDTEDASSVCSSTVTIKEVAAAVEALQAEDPSAGANSAAASPEKLQASASDVSKPQCRDGEIHSDKVK